MSDKVLPSTTSDSSTHYSLKQFYPLFFGLLVFVVAAVFVLTRPHIHPELLFDDFMNFLNYEDYAIPPYISIFSNLGYALWIGGGAFSLFAGIVVFLRHRQITYVGGYLLTLAAMGLFLGLDDMFMIHEVIIPRYVNVSESIVLAVYMALFGVLIVKFRRAVLAHDLKYFIIFVALFGLSQSVDLFRDSSTVLTTAGPLESPPNLVIVEELPKFMGLVFFTLYCLYYSLRVILRMLNGTSIDEPGKAA